MSKYIIGIDAGTTGIRAIAFDHDSNILSNAYSEFTQYFPEPGWVEHDANEIWEVMQSTLYKAIKDAKIATDDIIGMGITNQRESIVAWDKETGISICPSIVWQCRRTKDYCNSISRGMKKYIKKIK